MLISRTRFLSSGGKKGKKRKECNITSVNEANSQGIASASLYLFFILFKLRQALVFGRSMWMVVDSLLNSASM